MNAAVPVRAHEVPRAREVADPDVPAGAARGGIPLPSAGGVLEQDVADVEEGVPLQADVHEGGVHALEDVRDAALVDVPDDALLALDVQLDQAAVLDHGDPGFAVIDVDQDLLVEALARRAFLARGAFLPLLCPGSS